MKGEGEWVIDDGGFDDGFGGLGLGSDRGLEGATVGVELRVKADGGEESGGLRLVGGEVSMEWRLMMELVRWLWVLSGMVEMGGDGECSRMSSDEEDGEPD
ncbi:hypothetical protein V6N11_028207 [Hibiscus sabdariffa]|uniref:Uncharacterized protein n=2 Tax=Hibiscus sabdariffa TaxID=183260 RepID=A0ABR1ZWW9_9ROSI